MICLHKNMVVSSFFKMSFCHMWLEALEKKNNIQLKIWKSTLMWMVLMQLYFGTVTVNPLEK